MSKVRMRLDRLERERRRQRVPDPVADEPMSDEERIRLMQEIWERAERGDQDAPAGTLSWGERRQALLSLDEMVRREGMARLPTTAYQPQGVTDEHS